jgi:predicted PurR-regulated permease PerM
MFALDDRAGNVVTTVAVFALAASIVYLARGSFFILLLSVLFAYLLDPVVTIVQRHSRLSRGSRTWAIGQVYLVAILVLGSFAYALGPQVVAQVKSLNTALPQILEALSSGRAAATLGERYGLSGAQQFRIQEWLAGHRDLLASGVERGAASAAYVAAKAIWLFAVPILAIFLLQDRRQMADAIIQSVGSQGERTLLVRILRRVDTMLAKYTRAQLALSVLSFAFYAASLLLLGFPDAIALALLGGALEFLPTIGWIISAAVMLTIGYLSHAHWISMAGLVVVWRLLEGYVFSPRIMGNTLGLRPLTVLFALMAGGEVGGIAGLYLSVPAAAVLRIVWIEYFSSPNTPTGTSDQRLMEEKA